MFGPDWEEGCKACSFLCDHIDGTLAHLEHHDVTLLAISRAPLSKLEAYKERMGWRFKWMSSFGSDFNFDYHVSFSEADVAKGKISYNYEMTDGGEEQPGISVFYKDENGDILIGTYNYLDLTPLGRREKKGEGMDWVRRHDRYDD